MTTDNQTKAKPKTILIFVNNREVELHDKEVTGAEIKRAASIPAEFKLYDAKGDEVQNYETVKVHPKERFTSISGQDVS